MEVYEGTTTVGVYQEKEETVSWKKIQIVQYATLNLNLDKHMMILIIISIIVYQDQNQCNLSANQSVFLN